MLAVCVTSGSIYQIAKPIITAAPVILKIDLSNSTKTFNLNFCLIPSTGFNFFKSNFIASIENIGPTIRKFTKTPQTATITTIGKLVIAII